ncbi:hypothetical protein [Marinoscillum sp. MHG1-6]|uniref:hypothetical protein n=1 Tax=Marinoscillum sp. MHG1-6 TaxID=2959627 RepID=UPI002158885D|nr:hypothetical protein [Marinoscillum sp. MHG1-6]
MNWYHFEKNRLIAIFFLSVIVLGITFYHEVYRQVIRYKLENLDKNYFVNDNPKLLFTESVGKNTLLEPPFSDIVMLDLITKKKVRLNYDRYYDESPTLCLLKNCIYFTSKRGELAKSLHLGAPSDLYKVDLNDFEIKSAKQDVLFALKDSTSELMDSRVSKFNDSIMAFVEYNYPRKDLIFCDLKNKKRLYSISYDSVYHYNFLNNGVVVNYKSEKAIFYDFDGRDSRLIDSILIVKGTDYQDPDFFYSSLYDEPILSIWKSSLKDNSSENYYKIDFSINPLDKLGSIYYFFRGKYYLADLNKKNTFSNIALVKGETIIPLTNSPRIRDDISFIGNSSLLDSLYFGNALPTGPRSQK